jgi:hypothetical protein
MSIDLDKKEQIEKEILGLEAEMSSADFWNDKDRAQAIIKKFKI